MVRTYGQMPKQIFTSPHKKSSAHFERSHDTPTPSVLKSVKGLSWGIYTGSPALSKPKKLSLKVPILCKRINSKLVHVNTMNMYFVIPSTSRMMKSTLNGYDLVLWKEKDNIVRIKSLNEKKSIKLCSIPTCDAITSCGADINCSNLWFGHESGNITVYIRRDKKEYEKKEKTKAKSSDITLESIIDIQVKSLNSNDDFVVKSKWEYPITLLRHSKEILDIKICMEFKIAVSIGSDGLTVIWDSQKIEFIRAIEPSCNLLRTCLTQVAISSTLGDILTIFKPKSESDIEEFDDECFEVIENTGDDDFLNVSMTIQAGKSQLRVHNINGKYIKSIFTEGIVTACCFSSIKEGTGVNVIAIALTNGSIRLFSTWNFSIVREISTGIENLIKEISYSSHQYLTLLTDQEIHLWGCEGLSLNDKPNFHEFVIN